MYRVQPNRKSFVRTVQPLDLLPGSPQQEAIWEAIKGTRKNIIVQALAGTGKTYTIVEGLKRLPMDGLYAFVAFNKSIAVELQTRVPQGVAALTLHSLGFRAITAAWGKVMFDEDKVEKMLPPYMDRIIKNAITKLVSLAKGMLVDVSKDENIQELADRYGVEFEPEDADLIFSSIRDIFRQSYGRQRVIDYDDMIWLPVACALPVKPFDVIMVDEAQDLNRAQQELVLKVGKRIIMVGDANQAIYGFRGADVEAMDRMEKVLAEHKNGLLTFPLTVSRRCPKTVTELAAEIVPDFECLPEAIDGRIIFDTKEQPTKGDMVLCRVNAPLIKKAYDLIALNVPVKIQGRDIGQGLNNFIKKLANPTDTTATLMQRVNDYYDKESLKLRHSLRNSKKLESKLQSLQDKVDCVYALCEGMDTVAQVISRVEVLFSNVEAGNNSQFVLLSSVHRAKGLESDKVFILHWSLMPHPMANQAWQIQQEYNLKYVAITRAKKELHIF